MKTDLLPPTLIGCWWWSFLRALQVKESLNLESTSLFQWILCFFLQLLEVTYTNLQVSSIHFLHTILLSGLTIGSKSSPLSLLHHCPRLFIVITCTTLPNLMQTSLSFSTAYFGLFRLKPGVRSCDSPRSSEHIEAVPSCPQDSLLNCPEGKEIVNPLFLPGVGGGFKAKQKLLQK